MLRDANQLLVVPQKFRRPPARQHKTAVLGRDHIAERHVGIERITGSFNRDVPCWIVMMLLLTLQSLANLRDFANLLFIFRHDECIARLRHT